jgi:hypothetical protein
MHKGNTAPVVEFQRILDHGYQRALTLCEKMQDEVEQNLPSRLELYDIEQEEIEAILEPWYRQLYEEMAETMLKVLRVLQPEHFEPERAVNFYFWPGYHSHLINRRVFYRPSPRIESALPSQDFGVGLCGDPIGLPENLEKYNDSCQARWYHRAALPPVQKDFYPASPYHWFLNQQPGISKRPHDLVASVTCTTISSVGQADDFPEHRVLVLPEGHVSSRDWGLMLADGLNSLPLVQNPGLKFPDRIDRASVLGFDQNEEIRLRTVRCWLLSLWMHSAFRLDPPDWWDDLISELKKQQLTTVLDEVSRTRDDPVARDWGDASRRRPKFGTWTTIWLHPLVAPPPTPLLGPRESIDRETEISPAYRRTIGWATILCSVPLGLPFISVVRQWIRSVYGMLRNAEVAGLLRNRESLNRAAQMARVLPHDLRRLIQESVGTMLVDIEDSSPDAIAYRRYVLMTLQAFSKLAYGISSVASDRTKAKNSRDEIKNALLSMGDRLVDGVHRVVTDIQHFEIPNNSARVEVSEPEGNQVIPPESYAAYLLLVGEMVRNYCEHSPKGSAAKLSVTRSDDRLEITMEGKAGNRPTSETYALLDNVLDMLRLGKATVEKLEGDNYRWAVIVYLSE